MLTEKIFKVPKRIMALVIFSSFIITIISMFGGLTKEWAWAIAPTIITANGLIIGFYILGATYFTEKKSVSDLYFALAEENITKILGLAGNNANLAMSIKDEIKKDPRFVRALSEHNFGGIMQRFTYSINFPLISMGSALCLFGAIAAPINSLIFLLFFMCSWMAIYFLIVGAYEVLHSINIVLTSSATLNVNEANKIIDKLIDQHLQQKTCTVISSA